MATLQYTANTRFRAPLEKATPGRTGGHVTQALHILKEEGYLQTSPEGSLLLTFERLNDLYDMEFVTVYRGGAGGTLVFNDSKGRRSVMPARQYVAKMRYSLPRRIAFKLYQFILSLLKPGK